MANTTYETTATDYADAVRAFYSPSTSATTKSVTRGVTKSIGASGELEQRARALAPKSARMTKAATKQLKNKSAARRAEASAQLLAKACLDLDVSQRLIEQAQAEQGGAKPKSITTRSAASRAPSDLLDVIEGKAAPIKTKSVRSRGVGTTKDGLAQFATATSKLIVERATNTGIESLGKILALGAFELIKGLELATVDVGAILGKGEKVSMLIQLGKDYIAKAFDALKNLLGPQLFEMAMKLAREQLEKLKTKKDEWTAKAIEKLYETEKTNKAVIALIAERNAPAEKIDAASQGISSLSDAFAKQVALIQKFYGYVGYANLLPMASLPQAKLVIALIYLLLGGYIVVAGADFVDAPNLDVKILNRVPGVKTVVEMALA